MLVLAFSFRIVPFGSSGPVALSNTSPCAFLIIGLVASRTLVAAGLSEVIRRRRKRRDFGEGAAYPLERYLGLQLRDDAGNEVAPSDANEHE
jgi:hypothetical protein